MLSPAVRVLVASKPVDMRKGFDGLAALVRTHLCGDEYSGHLYVFVSRRADRLKILYWDRGGFVLVTKRLERGRFRTPAAMGDQRVVPIDGAQLAMLLDGIDMTRVARPARWEPRRPAPSA